MVCSVKYFLIKNNLKREQMNETKEFSTMQDYIYNLGHFWQSFNALELHLRIYLNKKNGNDGYHVAKYTNMSVGDECDENAITDYKTFSKLCELFNKSQPFVLKGSRCYPNVSW